MVWRAAGSTCQKLTHSATFIFIFSFLQRGNSGTQHLLDIREEGWRGRHLATGGQDGEHTRRMPLLDAEWPALFSGRGQTADRPGLFEKEWIQGIGSFHESGAGMEKFILQGYPVHRCKLEHMTDKVGISLLPCFLSCFLLSAGTRKPGRKCWALSHHSSTAVIVCSKIKE